MATTSDYLNAVLTATNNLQSTLDNFAVNTTGKSKLNQLVSITGQIERGTGYCHATITANKTPSLTFSGFNFVPASFAISSEYALEHTYSVAGNAYNVVGVLTLEGLEIGTQTHSVEVMLNDTLFTITVTTVLSNALGISTLTVTLPSGYNFLGEYGWAVLGGTSYDEDDEEDEE